MAVRKQRATTKTEIIDTNIDKVVKYGKQKYRNFKDEFYIFETREGSGYYFAESQRLNEEFVQHWKFLDNKWRVQ